VRFDHLLVMTITEMSCLLAPSTGDHVFTCSAISSPPQSSCWQRRALRHGGLRVSSSTATGC